MLSTENEGEHNYESDHLFLLARNHHCSPHSLLPLHFSFHFSSLPPSRLVKWPYWPFEHWWCHFLPLIPLLSKPHMLFLHSLKLFISTPSKSSSILLETLTISLKDSRFIKERNLEPRRSKEKEIGACNYHWVTQSLDNYHLLGMLIKIDMLDCKPIDTLIEHNHRLVE